MLGLFLGGVATLCVAVFFPVTFQKFVTFVRGFWVKAVEAEKDTPEVK